MAVNENATYLQNLVDPEVLADLVEQKLTNAIKFAPLAKIDTTLVGNAGSTVTLPSYQYIGKATPVAEGQPVPIKKLNQATAEVKISKLGNGIELTDEAVLSGYGDPIGEGANQLVVSIADAIDDELIAVLNYEKTSGTDKTPEPLQADAKTAGAIVAEDIADALVAFGEDIDGDKVVLVSAKDYANIRKDEAWVAGSDVGANIVIQGTVGMIHGCQVVVSNRVVDGTAYIVKPEALAIFLKRDVMVETDRDIINKSTVVTADKHCAVYLYNASKAIKVKNR